MAILFDARAREILAARYRHWPSRFRWHSGILETELVCVAAVPRFMFSFFFFSSSSFANVSTLHVKNILYYYRYTLYHYSIVNIHYYVIIIIM